MPLPPPVQAWQYDEIVFNDPYENFLNILTAHPPTPFPPPTLGVGMSSKWCFCLIFTHRTLGNMRPIPWHPAWPKNVIGDGSNVAGEGTGDLRAVPGYHNQLSKEEGERLKGAVAEIKAMIEQSRTTLEEKEKELASLKAR